MATQMASRASSHLLPKSKSLPAGSIVGVVVSAGKMQNTVKVRTTKQKFGSFLKRHYQDHPTYMVADPADSLREGDVVRIAPYHKTPKVKHVVTDLMVPFGIPADQRPAVIGLEELVEMKRQKHEKRWDRRMARKQQAYAEEHDEEGLLPKDSDKQSDETGKRIDALRQQGVEQEERAEAIAKEADADGIDLSKRLDGVRL